MKWYSREEVDAFLEKWRGIDLTDEDNFNNFSKEIHEMFENVEKKHFGIIQKIYDICLKG